MRCPSIAGVSVVAYDAHTIALQRCNVKGAQQLTWHHPTKHNRIAMSAPVSFIGGDAQPVNTELYGASSYYNQM